MPTSSAGPDQQQEELEQREPRREDLGALPFGHDDHRQLAGHVGHPDDFAPVVTVERHRFTWLCAKAIEYLRVKRRQFGDRGPCAKQRLASRGKQQHLRRRRPHDVVQATHDRREVQDGRERA